jgi:hypothetical protein
MDNPEEMDIFEKENRLHDELMNTIERFTMEHNLTYAQILGMLTLVKHEMMLEFFAGDCNCEDEEDE